MAEEPDPPPRAVQRRRRSKRIEPFHGFGTPERFWLKGRVYRGGVRPVRAEDGALRNLWNTARRIAARGAAGVRVRARFAGNHWEAFTDARGYFEIDARLPHPVADGHWHRVELELPDAARGRRLRAPAFVLVPSRAARFGIISDIDDTVVRTEATSLLRMLRIVFLTNAHSRMPFDDVDQLYRALQAGREPHGANPIFYVSSSPWNLYDPLAEFFRVHGIPEGPLFLRDWDFSPRKLLGMKHQEHKLQQITRLYELYPNLSWVLIGDSGQEDPEIYREIGVRHPERIEAIYIRDVSPPARDREVQAIADELHGHGIEMVLVQQKSEAGEHAAARGLIEPWTARSLTGDG